MGSPASCAAAWVMVTISKGESRPVSRSNSNRASASSCGNSGSAVTVIRGAAGLPAMVRLIVCDRLRAVARKSRLGVKFCESKPMMPRLKSSLRPARS